MSSFGSAVRLSDAPTQGPFGAQVDRGSQANEGEVLSQRYVLLRLLGEGGMGQVYAALDLELQRQVAVKLVKQDVYDASQTNMSDAGSGLIREAQKQAKISHPNVTPIFDVGRDKERLFLAMELIPGVDFRKWLRKKDRSWSEVVSILIPAAKGLQAAHDAGVLHRDFKPDNILIDEKDRPYVSDFGLAVSERLQRVSLPVEKSGSQNDLIALSSFRRSGTPGYLAPEYLEYGLYDEKSDQFAFGVTLYESVYGKRPFSFSLVHEQLIEIERGPRFPRRTPPVPEWLEHVIARCLHPDASKRWSSVSEIADALRSGIIRPRQRRQFLFQAACTSIVAASVFAMIPSASVQRCQAHAVEKSPYWNAPRALKIHSHFESFADRNGGRVFEIIQEKLNDRYEKIQDAYLKLCESTLDPSVGERASNHRTDEISQCLDRVRASHDGFVHGLEQIDAEHIDGVHRALMDVPEPSACFSTRAREQNQYFAVDAQLSLEARAELSSLRSRLYFLAGQTGTRHITELMHEANRLMEDIRRTNSRSLVREAADWLGKLHLLQGDAKGAIPWVEEAFHVATATGQKEAEIRSLIALLRVYGTELLQREKGNEFARALEAAYRAANEPASIGVDVSLALGSFASARQDIVMALRYQKKAKKLALENKNASVRGLVYASTHIGVSYAMLGKFESARDAFNDALSLVQRSMSDDQYIASVLHINLSLMYEHLQNYELELKHGRAAYEICESNHPGGVECAARSIAVTGALLALGRTQEALQSAREASLRQSKAGRRGGHFAGWAHEQWAEILVYQGKFAEANQVLSDILDAISKRSDGAVDYDLRVRASAMVVKDRLNPGIITDERWHEDIESHYDHLQFAVMTIPFLDSLRASKWLRRGDYERARVQYANLLANATSNLESDASTMIDHARFGLARALLGLHRNDEAFEVWEAIDEARVLEGHCNARLGYSELTGELMLAREEPMRAMTESKRSLACLEEMQADPSAAAVYYWIYARALKASAPSEMEAAFLAAQKALDCYGDRVGFERERSEISRWMHSTKEQSNRRL